MSGVVINNATGLPSLSLLTTTDINVNQIVYYGSSICYVDGLIIGNGTSGTSSPPPGGYVPTYEIYGF